MYGVRLNLKILLLQLVTRVLGTTGFFERIRFRVHFRSIPVFVYKGQCSENGILKQHFPFSYCKITTTHNTIRLRDDPLGVKKNERTKTTNRAYWQHLTIPVWRLICHCGDFFTWTCDYASQHLYSKIWCSNYQAAMRCSRRWTEVQRALDSNERKNIGFSGARSVGSVHGFVATMFVADTNEPYSRTCDIWEMWFSRRTVRTVVMLSRGKLLFIFRLDRKQHFIARFFVYLKDNFWSNDILVFFKTKMDKFKCKSIRIGEKVVENSSVLKIYTRYECGSII